MRKFLTLLSAILLSAVTYADGSLRLYCQMTYEWWTTDDAAIAMYAYADGNVTNGAWPGIRMMAVDGQTGVWYADVDSALYTNVIFVRVNGSDELADWGAKTADLTIPRDGNYLYTITSSEAVWSDGNGGGTVSGVWRNYADVNTPLDGSGNGGSSQTTYYLIGNFTNSWSMDDALAMDGDSIITNLQAGEYKFKVVRGLTWDNALGYNNLDYGCSSYNIRSDDDGNVCVTLASEGTLSVRVDNGQLCVNGTFANTDNQAYFIALVSPEGAGYTSPAGANYTIGSTFEVTASISTGGWMFDRWSDNDSWDNPRTITLTQDTTITAIFSPGEYGLQINGTRTVPGTYTGRVAEGSYVAQFLVTTYLNEGDQIKVINLFHNDNSTWRPEIENGGMSGNFVNSDGNLMCYTAGCYDIYIKIAYGQSEDYVYIAEGSNCDDQQGGNTGGNTDEEVLYSTTFFDWESMTVSTERTMSYSGYPFTFNNVKITPDQKPTSVSDASAGYIKPTSTSSCYVQVGALTSVTRVTYKQAASVAGAGWRLESSSNGVDWYAFNDNEEGVATANQVEQREVYVYMENVWLRWVPLPSNSNTNVYLTEFAIYGIVSSSGPEIVASGECAANGSAEVTWLLSSDSILTIGGSGRMADYDEDSNLAPWYQYKDAYNSVYIAAGVTNVGDLAFRQSNNLRYVDLASTVTELGSYSFYSCPALHTFTLPDNVTTLGENSPFGGTTTMTSPVYNSHVFVCLNSDFTGEYTVSSGTTTVASHAFRGCSMLTSVVLPSTVTSLPGSSTFENCSALASVNIPEGVTSLGEYAFSGCTSLMGIDLPSTMSSLGSYCLAECSAIDSIVCRATTPPTANGSTFSGVREGTTIYVPGQSIETYLAADGWSSFGMYQALEQSGGTCTIASGTCGAEGDNLTWVLDCDSVLTISGTGAMPNWLSSQSTYAPWRDYRSAIKSAVISEGVTNIGSQAFNDCANLSSVSIANTVTALGSSVFFDCTSLTEITIPESVMEAEYGIFTNCTGLTQPIYNSHVFIYMPATYSGAYTVPEGITMIAGAAFSGCSQITAITLPSTAITYGGGNAFADCSSLTSINLPEGTTRIENYALYGCTSLTTLEIPSTVTYIGWYGLGNCTGLESITCNAATPPTISSAESIDSISTAIPVYVPAESIELYRQAEYWSTFTNFHSLDECIVASGTCGAQGNNMVWSLSCDSVLTISGTGEMATYNSNTTPWLSNAAAIKSVVVEQGVTSISSYAFYNSGSTGNYSSLTHVSIPSSISTLSNNQFWQCPIQTVELNSEALMQSLTSSSNNLMNMFGAQVREYIIGDSVQTIGKYAFYNQSNDSLRTIVLPEGLTTISTWGFGYLENLRSIVIPDNVTTIAGNAFSGCSNLRSVVIGSGVTSIASQAFRDCNSLTVVTCNGTTPPMLSTSDVFAVQDTLFVPCESKEEYGAAQYWSSFNPIMCADDTVQQPAPETYTFALGTTWQFIMLPTTFGMTLDDIVVDGETAWGTYNSEQRAAGRSGWQAFDPATGFSGSIGYIIRARNDSSTLTIHIPEQARQKAAGTIPFAYYQSAHQQNANWNFIGNPYPFRYDIMAALEAADIEAPIAVWNGTGYTTYTPGIDEFVLEPFTGYFIQLPDNGPETLPLSADYIVE